MTRQAQAATLGGGCFWCLEAIYQQVKGVSGVVSGYAGGHAENPDYKSVCTGATGHAEVVRITFDPAVISYMDLLHIFWRIHDPTTLNRQGGDVGTQYRSIILYHDDEQKRAAGISKTETDASDLWNGPLVTEIEPLREFTRPKPTTTTTIATTPGNPTVSWSSTRKWTSSGSPSST